jgi:hypothetical protein
MAGARRSIGWDPRRGCGALSAALLLLFALLAASLCSTTAQAGELGANDQLVLAALAGTEPLPLGEMARESARGFEGESQAGVHIPVTVPMVRLWDDVGAFSPPSISNTMVTISSGPGQ